MNKKPDPPTPPARRIIERPRLMNQLEESNARTILLIAPAGYGKTTLGNQWLGRHGGVALPIRATGEDIAVIARLLAQGVAQQAPQLPRRVDEAIRVAPTPMSQAQGVVHAVLDEVQDSLEIGIFIDDYHLLNPEKAAGLMFETLERTERFRFLISSRTRPSWLTVRREIYGETTELGQAQLAFDNQELDELVQGRVDTRLLHREAGGWPALIDLVATIGSSHAPHAPATAATLDRFLADEVYERASAKARHALLQATLLPFASRESLQQLTGDTTGVDEALLTGIACEASGVVEVLPIARRFLLSIIASDPCFEPLVVTSIDFALAHSRWSEAFELITHFRRHEYLDSLITNSYLPLSEEGRVGTIAAFGEYGAKHGETSQALLDLINADLSYREGSFKRASALGLAAAKALPPDHKLSARCYMVSGLSAMLDWRLDHAFEVFDNALAVAKRPRDANDACWGRCVVAGFLEDERLRDAVDELAALPHPAAEDRLRLLMGRQTVARLLDGLYDMDRDIATAESLLPSIVDPLVRTAWGNASGYILLLQGRYDEALRLLTRALHDIERYDLSFGRPHIEWSLAATRLGLRQFGRADALLRRVERRATETNSTYLQLNACALRARMLLSQRRPTEALNATAVEFPDAPRDAMYGEYLGTRALALAIVGRREEALALSDDAGAFTRAVETRVMVAATRAVSHSGTSQSESAAHELVSVATTLGSWDGFVCAVRASPSLLQTLANSHDRALLRDVLNRSNDGSLAFASGLSSRRPRGRDGTLSKREAEVLDLLSQGLRTRDIAAALYLADSTVKVYVRNILGKLNAHTRAEAVARYAEANTETLPGTTEPPISSP